MKVADFQERAALPVVPEVVELAPGSRYIMVLKGTQIEEKQRQMLEQYLRETQELHVTIISVSKSVDVSFYDLSTGPKAA